MPQTREEKLAKMRERARHRREWLRAHGMCDICGQAAAVKGKHACADCLAQDSERHIVLFNGKSEAEKKKLVQRNTLLARQRWNLRKENHECTRCGKKLPEGRPFFTCDECRARARRAKREREERKKWAKV